MRLSESFANFETVAANRTDKAAIILDEIGNELHETGSVSHRDVKII
jgi:hypothetical protein